MEEQSGGSDWTSSRTFALYVASLAATVMIAVLGLLSGNAGDLILTVPVAMILASTVFTEKQFVHIPPVMIFMMVCTFLLASVAKLMRGWAVGGVATVLMGVNLELIGLICVYMITNSRDTGQRLFIPVSLSIAISIFVLMRMLQHYLSLAWDLITPIDLNLMMDEMGLIIAGALLTAVLFHFNRTHHLFKYTVFNFFENNAGTFGIGEETKREIRELISKGESDHLEFKSTLRTNLASGETDKRMEKAVLKTIVAFLNTDGGTLLIGVSDDGGITGIDEESFENRDKMNLHFTNILSSMVGNEFLPYVRFYTVDFDEGCVMRVDCIHCSKPVFLKEGKNEMFFVRSGPSSVELTGKNLVNYVRNRSRRVREEIVNMMP